MDRRSLRHWLGVLSSAAMAVAVGGCMCSVQDDPDDEHDCLAGVRCPDGNCVVSLLGGESNECCGFGGDCNPCALPLRGYECPDGTCALTALGCCMHGGACDPGDTDSEGTAASSSGDASTTDATASTSTAAGSDGSGTAGTDGSTTVGAM